MSETHGNLSAQARTDHGKGVARKLRAAGKIPAVVYGRGEPSELIAVDPSALRKAMDPVRKLNTLFHLTIASADGKGSKVEPCIIADYQMQPVRDEMLHVDFLRVDPNKEIHVKIPVEYVGRSVGVAAGGRLKTLRRDVRVAALPAQVPEKFIVDITPLQMGQQLRLKDVPLVNARLLDNPEQAIALVIAVRKRAEEATKAADPKKKK